MSGIGTVPALFAGLADFIDARIRALAGTTPSTVAQRFGTITAVGPVAVQLDGDPAPVGYPPACLYAPTIGDRVLCTLWGTQVAILGPIGGPASYDAGWTDTGWTDASFYTPNGFDQATGADKAQVRELGPDVRIRGSFQRTATGGGFGNGILVGLPQAPQTQHVGTAQWQSGARCDLVIYAGDTEVVADVIASSGTFGTGWVRIGAGAGYSLTPW